MQRVKLYRLNKEGGWNDQGTGNASLEVLSNKVPALVVVSEENHKPLLVHRIHQDVRYNTQPDSTIISWSDPELRTDLALSFQERSGCTNIWAQLASLQKEGESAGFRRRVVDEFESGGGREGVPASGVVLSEYTEGGNAIEELPEPSMKNLEELRRVLGCVAPFQRERMAIQVMSKGGFVVKLMEVFRQCEDVEDQIGLGHVHKIVKGLIMLTENPLLEEMFKEENILDVVGALEYDPEVSVHVNHREFLKEKVIFKEVIPIKDPVVRGKIHQTYRIMYIKDVVLPRLMDDQVTSTLASLIMLNQMDIIVALDQDPSFLPDLFKKVNGLQSEDPQWYDLISFLQEFCMAMKLMQPRSKQILFTKLVDLGLYDILTEIMKQSRIDVRLKATDIFTSATMHDISSFRCYLGHQDKHELLGYMVRDLINCGDNGLSEQFLDILRSLLDSDTMEGPDKLFLDVFYEQFLVKFVDALGSSGPNSTIVPSVKGAIFELMGFCVQHHAYNIKYYFLRNNVLDKVVTLLASREKWLVVACVRFLRTCIAMKDDFYERYIVRNNLFDPMIDIFLKNGGRYNLLNSTVLELVDFIRKEKLKTLVSHLVDKYYSSFKDISYVHTFQELKLEYDKAQEPRNCSYNNPIIGGTGQTADGVSAGAGRKRRDIRSMPKEEEDYFSESSTLDDDGEMLNSTPELSPLPLSQRHYSTCADIPNLQSSARVGEAKILAPDSASYAEERTLSASGSSNANVGTGGALSGLVDYDDEELEDVERDVEHQTQQSSGMKRNMEHSLPDAKRPNKVVNCG